MQGQQSDRVCDSTQWRCGLVLSGGGAKGLAHIALLELIDSLQIQVDYLSGTSMGAVVGGLYATGYSAAEIKEMVRQEDWGRVLSNRLPYDKVDMCEKEDYGTYTLGDCCTYYLSDLLHISLIISIFVLCLKAF